MNIKHVVEKEDGSVVFQGSLTGPELAFVIETGLNVLIAENAIPFLMEKDDIDAVLLPPIEKLQ